ncbi:MAG: AAA family ATPase [Candidatus Thorarchaeota archaeon]
MNKFILALCGLPSSGKSALADAIQKALNYDVEIVRTDDWRDESYYDDWRPEKEGLVRKAALGIVEKLVVEGKNVIHDDTNYYNSMRHDLFKIAIDKQYAFGVLHVSTPLDIAKKWNSERSNTPIPNSVIEKISSRFDLPGRRYLWDDSIAEVNMATQDLESVIPDIVESIRNLEIAMEPKQGLVSSTEFEKLDVDTRKIVSEFLEKHPQLRGRREVSEIRRNILRQAVEREVSVKDVEMILFSKLNELL